MEVEEEFDERGVGVAFDVMGDRGIEEEDAADGDAVAGVFEDDGAAAAPDEFEGEEGEAFAVDDEVWGAPFAATADKGGGVRGLALLPVGVEEAPGAGDLSGEVVGVGVGGHGVGVERSELGGAVSKRVALVECLAGNRGRYSSATGFTRTLGALFDGYGGEELVVGGLGGGGGAGVDAEEEVAGVDLGAGFGDVVEADGGVDGVGGAGSAGAEFEHGLAEDAGVHAGEDAAAVGAQFVDDGGGVSFRGEGFEGGGVATLGFDHLLEAGPGGAIAEACGEGFARGGGDGGSEVEDDGFEVGGAVALKAGDAFGDFEGVACAVAGRLVHGVEEGGGLHAEELADADHGVGEGLGLLARFHESAGAVFDIEHEAVQAFSEFFAHDGGGDEGDGGDGAGDVAQGIEFFVSGTDVGGLTDHDAAESGHDLMHSVDGELGGEAGDGLEFVEGAAGDAKAATGDHGDPKAVAGEEGGEDEGGFVTDAAGAVFVDSWGSIGGPGEDATGVEHGVGERTDFFCGHAPEEDGHGEGAHLVVGHVARGEGRDEVVNFVGGEGVTFAFALDEGGDVHLREVLGDF